MSKVDEIAHAMKLAPVSPNTRLCDLTEKQWMDMARVALAAMTEGSPKNDEKTVEATIVVGTGWDHKKHQQAFFTFGCSGYRAGTCLKGQIELSRKALIWKATDHLIGIEHYLTINCQIPDISSNYDKQSQPIG